MKSKLKRKSENKEGRNWEEGESTYQNDETKRRRRENVEEKKD